MTSLLKVNSITAVDGDDDVDVGALGTAKALANLNGTGTVALRDSMNISSVTDNGTADYTFNMNNAFSDATFTTTGQAGYDLNPATGALIHAVGIGREASPTASAVRVETAYGTTSPTIATPDFLYVHQAYFGALA